MRCHLPTATADFRNDMYLNVGCDFILYNQLLRGMLDLRLRVGGGICLLAANSLLLFFTSF